MIQPSTDHRRLSAVVGLTALVLFLFAGPAFAASGSASSSGAGLSGVVNVNTASAEELQLLPGVGASRASAIVALRKSRGAFKSVDDLMEVKGIGPAMLERMRPHVAIEGRTTARAAAKAKKSDPGGAAAGGSR